MSFALDLSKFSKLTEKKMETVDKKVFIDLSTAIIKDTPVLSGMLRNNWFPAINKFSDDETTIKDKSGEIAISRTVILSNKYKLGDILTLTNNLPYAPRIEFLKWSKIKAPRGMVRINITKWQSWVDKEARKVK